MAEYSDQTLFKTKDPSVMLEGASAPALTTLLHRVCDNDRKKFEEATRVIRLFILEARTDERASVVTWLGARASDALNRREKADKYSPQWIADREEYEALDEAADAIERGEHLESK